MTQARRRRALLIWAGLAASWPPGEVLFEQSTKFELVVNQSLARHYGMTIPQSVLLQATEVIR